MKEVIIKYLSDTIGNHEIVEEVGELIRCINCQRYNPNFGDNKETGYCSMLGSTRVPRDGYCAWAKKREDGEEPPKCRIGAFPQ